MSQSQIELVTKAYGQQSSSENFVAKPLEVQDDHDASTVASSVDNTNVKCIITLIDFEMNCDLSSDDDSDNESEFSYENEDSTECSNENPYSDVEENDDII